MGSGEVSCSSMAIVAYTCGGGVGILKVVVDCDVVGAGDVGVDSTVITGGAGATSCCDLA